jgi:hypothetical protein
MSEVRESALARLDAALGPRGQWPGSVVPTVAGVDTMRDLSPPLTALGILALTGTPDSGTVIDRSRQHLRLTVRPGGMWRYYADIPVDTDDSAMCALALGPDDPILTETRATLTSLTRPDGLFPTWFEPGWTPCVDAVANAHIVAVLGSGPATGAAVGWLHEVVHDAREVESCVFYPDPLDVHMAIGRAYAAGVAELRPAVDIAADRALDRLSRNDLSAYRLAQAIVVATSAGESDVDDAKDRLRALRQDDGTWPADTLYVAGNTRHGGLWQYQSWAVVTALAIRALVT